MGGGFGSFPQGMKITMVTTDFFPNIGGVAQHIFELARALRSQGDEVEIIAPAPSSRWQDLKRPSFSDTVDGITVWRIPFVVNRAVKFITGQITGRLSKRRFYREVAERLQAAPPELLHWHAIDAHAYPAEHFDGPRVWTNHTSNFIDGMKIPAERRHYAREASLAHQIICPSEELADLTRELGVAADRVHFLSNGVDAGRFHPGVEPGLWKERLGLGEHSYLVLCPRRLEVKNGVSYFLKAAIGLQRERPGQDIHFAVAGNYTGPKSDSEEDLARELVAASAAPEKFHLLGRVENREMPGLYAAADVVVMPSLIEATSLSAMEGMATAKPVVSTDVGGLPFLIHDGENGILVPARDPAALQRGIRTLLEDPALRQKMGLAGRKRVEEELDWQAVAQKTRGIYLLAEKLFRSR